jgi:hypothetical protein
MDGMFGSASATTIAERLASAGEEWADKEAAASLLEDTRKRVRAQVAVAHIAEGASAAKAELLAEASDQYHEHLQAMVEARKAANIARVNYDAGKTWTDLVRTQEATKRAEMNLR